MSRLWYDATALRNFLESFPCSRPLVLANGCFDILHVGHVRYLEAASNLGSTLVVAVNDDESTSKLKGRGRPVVSALDRASLILALRCVDYVLIFGSPTVDEIILTLRPDFHAKGTDYSPESVPEKYSALEVGCKTVIVGDSKSHSSRDIIRRIVEAAQGGS